MIYGIVMFIAATNILEPNCMDFNMAFSRPDLRQLNTLTYWTPLPAGGRLLFWPSAGNVRRTSGVNSWPTHVQRRLLITDVLTQPSACSPMTLKCTELLFFHQRVTKNCLMSSTANEITPRAIYSYYELISRSKCLNGVNHLTCSSTWSSECHLFKKEQKTLCDPLTCRLIRQPMTWVKHVKS